MSPYSSSFFAAASSWSDFFSSSHVAWRFAMSLKRSSTPALQALMCSSFTSASPLSRMLRRVRARSESPMSRALLRRYSASSFHIQLAPVRIAGPGFRTFDSFLISGILQISLKASTASGFWHSSFFICSNISESLVSACFLFSSSSARCSFFLLIWDSSSLMTV
ncbi:uncharacterized protein BKA78DRAFT_303445 [Phyllosticta capitalensis]|uniref:uncharacterized protein n=1 Tax=Phyllosticta capitalensis TaxID=121624 RepID=UPI00312FE0D3